MSVFYHAVFVFTRFCRARCSVMMFTTCSQTLSQRTLYCEIATGLWFEMSVVYFHLNNSHELNLASKFLYLFLRGIREDVQSIIYVLIDSKF